MNNKSVGKLISFLLKFYAIVFNTKLAETIGCLLNPNILYSLHTIVMSARYIAYHSRYFYLSVLWHIFKCNSLLNFSNCKYNMKMISLKSTIHSAFPFATVIIRTIKINKIISNFNESMQLATNVQMP